MFEGIRQHIDNSRKRGEEAMQETRAAQIPQGFATSGPIMGIRDFIVQLIYSITHFLGGDKVVQPPEPTAVASAAPSTPSAPECTSPQCELKAPTTPAIAVKPIRQR